jgi:hypothetical protein
LASGEFTPGDLILTAKSIRKEERNNWKGKIENWKWVKLIAIFNFTFSIQLLFNVSKILAILDFENGVEY